MSPLTIGDFFRKKEALFAKNTCSNLFRLPSTYMHTNPLYYTILSWKDGGGENRPVCQWQGHHSIVAVGSIRVIQPPRDIGMKLVPKPAFASDSTTNFLRMVAQTKDESILSLHRRHLHYSPTSPRLGYGPSMRSLTHCTFLGNC